MEVITPSRRDSLQIHPMCEPTVVFLFYEYTSPLEHCVYICRVSRCEHFGRQKLFIQLVLRSSYGAKRSLAVPELSDSGVQ